MSKYALPCIICGKPLVNVDEDIDNQPSSGTEFSTRGHYGSSIIDVWPGEARTNHSLEFVVNICDTCILRALDAGVIQSRTPRIVLSRHPVTDRERAWVLAQNYKKYGAIYGDDQPVDYDEEMAKVGLTLPLV